MLQRFVDQAAVEAEIAHVQSLFGNALRGPVKGAKSTARSRKVRIPMMADSDSDRSRTAFRSMADRIPTHRGQRSDDRGQLLLSTASLAHEAGLASMAGGTVPGRPSSQQGGPARAAACPHG
jgi:3,4-dihydroxy-2-butanone 4-phosphate synthase